MRITDYELFEVPPRWLFLRLETNDGVVGWGEPVVQGRARTVRTAVEELLDNYLVGEDPLPIEHHWQRMYRGDFYRGGPVLMSAIAGIDQALWDIKGKHYGAPVYELLGGYARERVRVHHWLGFETADDIGTLARSLVEEHGFTALKMNATAELERIDTPRAVKEASARLGRVRDAVGDDVDIGIDFHGRASKSMAKRLVTAFEEHDPMFYEKPVLPEHNDVLGDLAQRTSVPISTGERLYTRWDFKPVVREGHVDIIQPDLSHAGGITEVRKIATMAEAFDITVMPHCPLGPIALASCLQVDACSPNAILQEQGLDLHLEEANQALRYLSDPSVFDYEDGYLSLPAEPGLGVDIDESAVRDAADHSVDWHNPVWYHRDGSVAEW
ncbi:galactonate dehydratase [Halarchaeum grantii]|uniref:Galactonate dehydratase n=1 Tax=Halarchaeum grantii TaxID=1193105 RepID=A0A830F6V4_9EURY|nr:galactonate dehydratase [Halarchaeum grantii]GGL44810.1 galactonate dehydratase [Halarchaeum grantii]